MCQQVERHCRVEFQFCSAETFGVRRACFQMLIRKKIVSDHKAVSLRTDLGAKKIFPNKTILSGLNDEALV